MNNVECTNELQNPVKANSADNQQHSAIKHLDVKLLLSIRKK